MIVVSEIFGPTIQGEGALIGTPTVFVRTAGCDFKCSWCDTLHAVDKIHKDSWYEMSAAQILQQVDKLTKSTPLLITLSGGNPATQDLSELILLGKEKGYTFSMETQGSISATWFSQLDHITFSPKPPSSNMRFNQTRFNSCISSAQGAQISLKIVVANKTDLDWVGEIRRQYPNLPLYLQPCNQDPEGAANLPELNKNTLKLVEQVLERGWFNAVVLPQLHVYLWGNKKGV